MTSEDWRPDSPIQAVMEQQAEAQTVIKGLQFQLQIFDMLKKKALQNVTTVCFPSEMASAESSKLSQALGELATRRCAGQIRDNEGPASSACPCRVKGDPVLAWPSVLDQSITEGVVGRQLTELRRSPMMASSHSNVCSTRAVSSSSPLKSCIDASAGAGDCGDELWDALERIGNGAERLKEELEMSQRMERGPCCPNNRLERAASLDAKSHKGPSGTLITKCGQRKMEQPSGRSLDLETQVDRLQQGLQALEEAQEKLQGQLKGQEDSTVKTLIASLQAENQRLNKTLVQLQQERECEVSWNRQLHSKAEEACANMAACLTRLTEDNQELRRQLEEKEAALRKMDNEKMHVEEANLVNTMHRSLDSHLEEQVRSKEAQVRALMETLSQERDGNAKVVAELEKVSRIAEGKLQQRETENKALSRELKGLLEKYSSLKKHVRSAEEQEQKSLAEKQHLLEARQQAHVEREAALRTVESFREELRHIKQDQYRNIEEKHRLEELVSSQQDTITDLKQKLQNANLETQKARDLLSVKDSEKEEFVTRVMDLSNENRKLMEKFEECIISRDALSQQLEKLQKETRATREGMEQTIKQMGTAQQGAERRITDLGKEREALCRLVDNLKDDKRHLREELQETIQEKQQLDSASRTLSEEHNKMRAHAKALERERDFLQAELSELRRDYLHLSDRIRDRLNDICQDGIGEESYMSLRELKIIQQEEEPTRSPGVEAVTTTRKHNQEERRMRSSTGASPGSQKTLGSTGGKN
ncbi:myosin heavy chain, embryonic smooth muscle isoform isoform X1 [Polypterus senegalus]|uniref:myosin heavy chain, embryonic smooth muscle isoform isoform X1 n=1 Tax=Polypterus senegalus TaxID=55291 RepID=UPI0019639EB5|nr:myosin heavy chain, embryonic smooth muscle isoform isoform X1 [Polypterus senegalus]XP_039593490.1 myosin heavy chain, embryonic smooth muscle isoform isoform X1 [Polypterus senegalus]XP_039593497.1 myosin heavy chain, embryonic smooth muscle isoform isoform X1 [Polypterus senegalus]